MSSPTQASILRAHGNVIPEITIAEASRAGLELAILAAVLDQESGGGHNEFGHDPVRQPQIVGGPVTKSRYRRYKLLRRLCGAQGVGPMQLTYPGFQDEADGAGGCWDPAANVRVGADALAASIRRNGLRAGLVAYNGSGPAAQWYADAVLKRIASWRVLLAPPPKPKPTPRPKPKPVSPPQGEPKNEPPFKKSSPKRPAR